jgi:hypothetical protein
MPVSVPSIGETIDIDRENAVCAVTAFRSRSAHSILVDLDQIAFLRTVIVWIRIPEKEFA